MEKVKKSKIRKQGKCRLQQQWRAGFPCWTGRNALRYNYVFYLFVSFWYYYIRILSRNRCSGGVFKKLSLKILSKFTRKHLYQSLFISPACNFVRKETLAQVPTNFMEFLKHPFSDQLRWLSLSFTRCKTYRHK